MYWLRNLMKAVNIMQNLPLLASQLLSIVGVIGFFIGNATLFLIGGIAGLINIILLRGAPFPRMRLVIISVGIYLAVAVIKSLVLPNSLSPSIILFLCVYPIVIWVYRSRSSSELQ